MWIHLMAVFSEHLRKTALIKSLQIIGAVSPFLAGQIALRIFTTPKFIQRPDWEIANLNSGSPLEFSNGVRGTRWGNSQRPIILLVHGWMGRGTQLSVLKDPLIDMGFQVIAIDGPAHGDSQGRRTAMPFFAQAILQVSEELGGLDSVYGVVAHSFGAGATTLAIKRGLKIKKFVLVASPSDFIWVIEGFAQQMKLSPTVARAFYDSLEKWTGLKVIDTDIAAMGKLIETPTLILHDPKDREVPFQQAQKLNKSWPSSTLMPLENVGHRKILKAPTFVKATVDFLKS